MGNTLNKQKKLKLVLREDSDACMKIIHSGKFDALRHVNRTQDVEIQWLRTERVETKLQAADIFTKPVVEATKWDHLCKPINHVDL